jgi:hypothetical protein
MSCVCAWHEGIWEKEGISHSFLTLARGKNEWTASRPGCFNPKEQAADLPIEQEPERDSANLNNALGKR